LNDVKSALDRAFSLILNLNTESIQSAQILRGYRSLLIDWFSLIWHYWLREVVLPALSTWSIRPEGKIQSFCFFFSMWNKACLSHLNWWTLFLRFTLERWNQEQGKMIWRNKIRFFYLKSSSLQIFTCSWVEPQSKKYLKVLNAFTFQKQETSKQDSPPSKANKRS
jgi:hypothetical protein